MFLSKENIIMEPSKKYIQVGNLFDESEISIIDICAIKTTLLPTIKLSFDASVLCPKAYRKENKYFLKNIYVKANKLQEDGYLFIPKIESSQTETFDKTLAWLYGKYIVSGYYKNNNGIEQLIIPVLRISQKEEKKIQSLNETFVIKSNIEPFNKVIITNNKEIIKLFLNFTKNKTLKQFIIQAENSLFNLFLRSILLETNNGIPVKIENAVLAHELFIHAYSKINKILKITEEHINKNKKKSKDKKVFYISIADVNDYELFGDGLYAKIIQNRVGKNTVGVDINRNKIYCEQGLICNSIVVKNDSFKESDEGDD